MEDVAQEADFRRTVVASSSGHSKTLYLLPRINHDEAHNYTKSIGPATLVKDVRGPGGLSCLSIAIRTVACLSLCA